ncbi:MAG: lamin tail domain-containing protein [Patescibacteria group bacterium]|nr:lamin tail domain-containing protein [Patescibacteria group bacterium]
MRHALFKKSLILTGALVVLMANPRLYLGVPVVQAADGAETCSCVCPATDATTGDAPAEDATASTPATETSATAVPHLVINELFPDPEGEDAAGEFIELLNMGTEPVDVAGWKITVNTRGHVLASAIVPAHGYYQFSYVETKLTLANGGATVTLIDPSGNAVYTVTYGSAKTGQTYARADDAIWNWTNVPTPAADNVFPETPATIVATAGPEVASEITDNVVTTIAAAGTVPSGGQSPIDISTAGVTDAAATSTTETDAPDPRLLIRINEFLPDPAGDDVGEWIELFNPSEFTAVLAGWSLDDDAGGSTPYKFTADDVVPAGGYLVMPRSRTKLALNNDGDAVRLLDGDGAVVQTVRHGAAAVGKSYFLGVDGVWRWTDEMTPGAVNTTVPAEAVVASMDVVSSSAATGAEPTGIAELPDLATGELVTVAGVVSLPPGRVSKTVFAIQSLDGLGGVFVRDYGSATPRLSVGDAVSITGRVSHANGRLRLGALAKGGIKTNGNNAAIRATTIALGGLADAGDGVTFTVSGLLTKFSQGWLKLTDESGETEIKASWPGLKISTDGWQADHKVTLTGVVQQRPDGPEVVVANGGGVVVTAPAPVEASAPATANQPAPNVVDVKASPWPLAASGAAAVLAAAGAAFYAWWRRRRWPEMPEISVADETAS